MGGVRTVPRVRVCVGSRTRLSRSVSDGCFLPRGGRGICLDAQPHVRAARRRSGLVDATPPMRTGQRSGIWGFFFGKEGGWSRLRQANNEVRPARAQVKKKDDKHGRDNKGGARRPR
ncbi:hypothetical protein BDU57DRAFT_110597 [Ampelomyces quisqualis]|uniref:Uncharacterized protein n=1 Tax=Ampelomyces quisqualis TaxID=50730 RepID=A0A6A5Q8Q1_AMPQU|nr:hypothetical protein BDU57DRAFT_110597 [Ampelomyces quisqualis]